ncbi:MAG: protein TolR, partial [Gammaproteobacteria bacterium]|nr:protein TolR [Gammaproteobacteria bacterium]
SIKVLIEGDQAVTYGYVMSAMDRLKNAGIEDVGLVTQPRSSESI